MGQRMYLGSLENPKGRKKLNWKNVRILTNMRKINVKVCLFELEKLDKDVYSLIRSII